jgi:hypothetical protein
MRGVLARVLLSLATALLVLLAPGCAFVSGVDEQFEASGPPQVSTSGWRQAKVYFRHFENQSVTARSTAYAVSSTGGSATASGYTVGTTTEIPSWILDAAATALPFQSITPTLGLGKEPPTYILEGSLTFEWKTPWWTWVQLIDIWIHAFAFPSLGRHLDMGFELALYDADHALIRRWSGRRVIKYVGQVWWLINHGGAGDSGFEEDYQRFLKDELAKVGQDMRGLGAQ